MTTTVGGWRELDDNEAKALLEIPNLNRDLEHDYREATPDEFMVIVDTEFAVHYYIRGGTVDPIRHAAVARQFSYINQGLAPTSQLTNQSILRDGKWFSHSSNVKVPKKR
ncbi:hypothetical protein ACQ4M3_35245 [Leptolyngbya sp. AN03gr2]|uniref:hypothetical protein n=1 Tax=unclassified Leptolyngbya TaxID=2650499 RepID=UPI003D31296C